MGVDEGNLQVINIEDENHNGNFPNTNLRYVHTYR